jgi:Domain of unknown function (DUF4139)/N-terminal domain of unknown function (DUF4140)
MLQIDCESRIDRVVVYARGAVVTRKVTLPESLPEGAVELTLAGITALAEAGSVRALAQGEREVTAIHARAVIPRAPAKPGRLRERLRALELEGERLEAERSLAAQRRAELEGLTPSLHFSRWARHADPGARFQDALALGGLVAEELIALDDRLRELDAAIEDHQRRLDAARLDAAQGTPGDLEGEARAALGVQVRLGPAGSLLSLEIDYVVTAARWWPAYTARLSAAATRVTLGMDAFVAQASGEAWSGVKLSVATADLASDVRLPELRSLRLGRAQPPRRVGYRPPPAGLDAMFEGHDRAVDRLEITTRGGDRLAALDESEDLEERTASRSMPEGGGGYGAPQGMPPPMSSHGRVESAKGMASPMSMTVTASMAMAMPRSMPMPAPARARASVDLRARKSRGPGSGARSEDATIDALTTRDEAASLGAAAPRAEPAAPEAIEPDEAWLDFDALTLADPLEPANRGRRGRLARDPASVVGSRAAAAQASIQSLGAPPEARDPLATRGHFDHRYDAEGSADVPASGRPHRVAIGSAEGEARPRFVAVPREAAEVYREAEITNPFAAPLLSGPVEVFLDGALLTTSSLAFVDRGGLLHLGLGVEERLRVARNARVEEGSAGLLGGSTTVDHHVTIDVASSLGHPVAIEVLDRIPVTSDKDIEIKLISSKPASTKITQAERGHPVRGGLAWNISVSPGEKQRIEVTYRVTLPAKNELVGGNRRE